MSVIDIGHLSTQLHAGNKKTDCLAYCFNLPCRTRSPINCIKAGNENGQDTYVVSDITS